jgi:hypothetical protein
VFFLKKVQAEPPQVHWFQNQSHLGISLSSLRPLRSTEKYSVKKAAQKVMFFLFSTKSRFVPILFKIRLLRNNHTAGYVAVRNDSNLTIDLRYPSRHLIWEKIAEGPCVQASLFGDGQQFT